MGIKGTTVTIRTKIQTGTDEFNAPVWKWVDEQVDNVLIAPSSSNEVLSANDLYGKKAVYTLIHITGKTVKSYFLAGHGVLLGYH